MMNRKSGRREAHARAGAGHVQGIELYGVAADRVYRGGAIDGRGNEGFDHEPGDGGVAAGKHLHGFARAIVQGME